MKRKIKVWLVFLLSVLLLSGCGDRKSEEVVLTTGLKADEVFRLGTVSCSLNEARIYLFNEQNRYEEVYGTEIWRDEVSGGELGKRLKDKVLAEISQIKVMTLLAQEKGITLDEEELKKTEDASRKYMESLSETEISSLEVSQELAAGMYRDYALADKVYNQIIADINPEISDDEARIITVQHILIRTGEKKADGSVDFYSEEKKKECYQAAQEAYRAAMNGESFELLMEKYNEAEEGTLSLGKGDAEQIFENAAFDLGIDEISGVIETSRGYEIIKCLNTFDREETDRNKLKIMERRRAEVFGEEYNAFVQTLVGELNQELWDSITLEKVEELSNSSFFDIYHEYFERR